MGELLDEIDKQCGSAKHKNWKIEGETVAQVEHELGGCAAAASYAAAFRGSAENRSAATSFEVGCCLVIFIGGDVDGHGGFFELFHLIVATPVFRIEFLDFIEVGGEADAALFEIFGFLAHFEETAIDECQRAGELFGELYLLGKEGALAGGEFFEFAFFALQFFPLELNPVEFFLRVLELAVVVFVSIRASGGRHFHLSRADFDVVGVFDRCGHN